ncbi:DMT family transporter [Polyangium aurulentum]|uniref:DMT family transporter n=1 Tax=Polyangium aurulentum TaxID=2567896 RepID=UPI0010AE0D33|nr:DMT family transporter [Polyangium aurulentum]UQA60314.1 DMT family transporter [Polyangium aurulentum]
MSTQTTAPRLLAPRTAYLLLGMVTLIWSANWPIMKWGLGFITPLWFAVARFALGALCLFGFLLATRRLRLPPRGDLAVLFTVGALQMGIFVMLTNVALSRLPAGRSAILAYTTPLWVLPGAVMFLNEKIRPLAIAGFFLGLAGVAALFNPASLDTSRPGVVSGHLMLVVGAACWAVAIVHVRGHRWRTGPLELAPFQMLIAIAVMTPFALALEGPPRFSWGPELFAVLGYNGPLATAFCFSATLAATRSLPAITTSLSFLAVPVLGAVMSTLALGETLGLDLVIGFALILGGVGLVTLSDVRERARVARASQG